MKTYFKYIVLLFVLTSIFFSLLLHAQTPQLLNYQGKLNNKDGTPTSGVFSIVFTIYADSTGGTSLWDETQDVTVMNGVFNVLLGSVESFPGTLFANGGERYLGVKVGVDPEMKPRFLLSGVPYAFRAAIADNVMDEAITYRKQTITTYKAQDDDFKRHTGTGQTKISEFTFTDVPAGDIFVILTCFAIMDVNSIPYGSVCLEIGVDNSVHTFPTHVLFSDRWTYLTLHGSLQNFSGGQLMVRLVASGERAETSFKFGTENDDGRFGRWLTMIAGL